MKSEAVKKEFVKTHLEALRCRYESRLALQLARRALKRGEVRRAIGEFGQAVNHSLLTSLLELRLTWLVLAK